MKIFFQKEICWSISKCDEYLKLLETKDGESDILKIKDLETVASIVRNYKGILHGYEY